MKTLFLISILTVIVHFAYTQEYNTNILQDKTAGLYDISDAKQINPTDVLIKYSAINVYKLNKSKNDTKTVKFGPANADLAKLFTENNNDSAIIIDDLSGINFVAIIALQDYYSIMKESIQQLEESQEIINRQTADMADMQNSLLQLMGEIEELKQKNIDIESNMENLKIEINSKE